MAKTYYDMLKEEANRGNGRQKKTNTSGFMDVSNVSISDHSGNYGTAGSYGMTGGTTGSRKQKSYYDTLKDIANGTMGVTAGTIGVTGGQAKPKQMKATNPSASNPFASDIKLTDGVTGAGTVSTPPSTKPGYTFTGTDYMAEQQNGINDMYESEMDSAKSYYDTLKKEAERQSLMKQGYVDTQRTLMEKYVPETLRAMGLSHNGLAADALIGMDANYTRYLLQALADEEDSKKTAAREYAEAERQAKYNKAQRESALSDKKQSYWETLRQMALSGDYSEEALQDYGYSYGLNEGQVGGILDLYRQVAEKQAAEEKAAAEAESKNMNAALSDMAAIYIKDYQSMAQMELALKQAGYTDEQIAIAKQYYTEQEELAREEGKTALFSTHFSNMLNGAMDEVHKILNKAELDLLQGDLSEEDFGRLEQLYSVMLEKGNLSESEYRNAVEAIRNGTYGKNKANTTEMMKTQAIEAAKSFAINQGKIENNASVINVNAADFDEESFGKFNDTGVYGSSQDVYIRKLIADAKSGKIKEGQAVVVNFGKRENRDSGVYMYVGNGCFVKMTPHYGDMNLYVPKGYIYIPMEMFDGAGGEIKKK